MKRLSKRLSKTAIVAVIAAMAMASMGLLAGCGGSDEPQVTDAASLAAASQKAVESVENFHTDIDMDMEMSMTMDGLKEVMGTDSLEMPMKMKMSLDSGKETAHGTSDVSMSMLGQSMEQSDEVYVDMKNGMTYTKTEGTDSWTKTDSDSSMSDMMDSISSLGEDVLSKAEFSDTENGYVLTLDAATMGEAIKEMDLFSNYSAAGMEFEEFNISSGQIVYTFDKATALPSKIEMQNLDITAKAEVQGSAVDIHIPMNTTMDYSQYGEIDPKAYEIPAEVTGAE